MNVLKLTPNGYCHGVIRAIMIAKNAVQNEKKPVYIMGSIIHNSYIVKAFEDIGAITLEEDGKTKSEMLNQIDFGTVIFTAHGIAPSIKEKALKKGLTVIDASCLDVISIHENYLKYLSLGYTCLYIGKKNHPECEGVLGISPKIKLVTSIEDITSLEPQTKIYLSNQTTLSNSDILPFYNSVKNHFLNPIIDCERCKATTNRQKALENNPTDLCYIIGDKKSSNTQKLYEVSKNYVKSIRIDSVFDINPLDLIPINSVSITAGASTPKEIIEDCYNYLKQFDKENPKTYENKIQSKIKL